MADYLGKALNSNKMKRIIDDFEGRISNSSQEHKWTFLNGHDVDITSMLIALDIADQSCI
jgi:hypothetical protein